MFNNINDRDQPTFNFGGIYRGEVVDNQDPQQAGRVKIEVFGVFDNMPTSVLPWAVLCDNLMGGTADVGGVFVPDVGSHVFVMFESSDHRYPICLGGAPAIQNGIPDLPEESRNGSTVYPECHTFKTKSGIYIELDDTENATRIKTYHPANYYSETDNDGNFLMSSPTTITHTSGGNILIESDAEITIDSANGTTVVSDNSINIESSTETTVKAGSSITVESSSDTTIKASGALNLESDVSIGLTAPSISMTEK